MPTTITIFELNHFLYENDIPMDECKFIGFVGHKEVYTVYGSLFETPKGLLLQQQKHVEINKGKPSTKIASAEICKHKFVGSDIYNSFKIIDLKEHSDRWGTDFNNLIVS